MQVKQFARPSQSQTSLFKNELKAKVKSKKSGHPVRRFRLPNLQTDSQHTGVAAERADEGVKGLFESSGFSFFDLCLVDVIQKVGLLNCFFGNVFFEIMKLIFYE